MTLVSMSAFILFAQLVMGNKKFLFIEILKKIFKFVLFFFLSLKSLDLVCMKKLDNKVNIIPVIAKADTISKPELMRFKVRIASTSFTVF